MGTIRCCLFLSVFLLLASGILMADGFEDSYLEFASPDSLDADTSYQFDLSVYNIETFEAKGKVGEWIYAIDLTLPSDEYVVDSSELEAPEPLHPEGAYPIVSWEASFDPGSSTISWICVSSNASSSFGDIREEEVLSFSFVAVTDEKATDGFPWVIRGDLGTDVEGIAYIGDSSDDDDLADDDDAGDDDSGSDDDDLDDWDSDGEDDMAGRMEEDESGGCGC